MINIFSSKNNGINNAFCGSGMSFFFIVRENNHCDVIRLFVLGLATSKIKEYLHYKLYVDFKRHGHLPSRCDKRFHYVALCEV